MIRFWNVKGLCRSLRGSLLQDSRYRTLANPHRYLRNPCDIYMDSLHLEQWRRKHSQQDTLGLIRAAGPENDTSCSRADQSRDLTKYALSHSKTQAGNWAPTDNRRLEHLAPQDGLLKEMFYKYLKPLSERRPSPDRHTSIFLRKISRGHLRKVGNSQEDEVWSVKNCYYINRSCSID